MSLVRPDPVPGPAARAPVRVRSPAPGDVRGGRHYDPVDS